MQQSAFTGALLLEEREVDAAVGAEVEEMRMAGEIVLVAVLKNKQTAILEQRRALTVLRLAEDICRQGRQFRQGIRRVGKDKVVTDRAGLQVAEHIPAYDMQIVDAERAAGGDDEVLLHMSEFDGRDLACTA